MFEQFLYSRFGLRLPDNLIFIERKNKVYLACRELDTVSYPRLQRKGILAGKLHTLFGPKPSLDFVFLFGHLATKNFLMLSNEEILQLYQNKRIPCSSRCGGVQIIKDSNVNGACLALIKQGKLVSLVPKERLLKPL